MHVHTRCSKDSLINPKKLPRLVKRKSLNGVAVTDHNNLRAFKLIPKSHDIVIVPGIEVKTTLGEVIGLYISEPIKPHEPNAVMDEIKDQGGLVILPHPYSFPRRSSTKLMEFNADLWSKVDAIEAFNSRAWTIRYNLRSLQLAQKLRKPVTAGSDAHFSLEVGNAYTLFKDVYSGEEVYKEIKNGRTWIIGKQTCPLIHMFTTMTKICSNIVNVF